MPSASPKRGGTARNALLALLFLICAASGFTLLQRNEAIQRRWQTTIRRIEHLRSEANSEDATRPPLFTPSVGGDAWISYHPAIREAARCREARVLTDFVHRRAKADPDRVMRLVQRHARATLLLREGARRTEARYRYSRKPFFGSPDPNQMGIQQLRFLARSEARFLAEKSEIREAFRLLGALAIFGRDLAHNSWNTQEGYGLTALSAALKEMGEILDRQKPATEDLHEAERILRILDEAFPDRRTAIRNNTLILGLKMLEEERRGRVMHTGPEPRTRHGWRWGFSSRLQISETFAQGERWMDDVIRAESLPWIDAQAARQDYEQARDAHADSIVRYAPNLATHSYFSTDTRTLLRLLRMRVRHERTGEILQLEDPYGVVLKSAVDASSVKFWSVGRNGKDETGVAPLGSGYVDDVTVEIKRPKS